MKKPSDDTIRDKIIECYRKRALPEVLKFIKEEFGIDASPRSLRTWLKDWGVRRCDEDRLAVVTSQQRAQLERPSTTIPDDTSTPNYYNRDSSPAWGTPSSTAGSNKLKKTIGPVGGRPDSPLLGTTALDPYIMKDGTQDYQRRRSKEQAKIISVTSDSIQSNDGLPFEYRDTSRRSSAGTLCTGHLSTGSQDSGYWSNSNRASTATALSYGSSNRPQLGDVSEESSTKERSLQQAMMTERNVDSRSVRKHPTPTSAADTHASTSTFPLQGRFESSPQPHFQQTSPAAPHGTVNDSQYWPPHASPSTCPMSRPLPFTGMTGMDGCFSCHATAAHWVGCMAHALDPSSLTRRLQEVSTILNHQDRFGNKPVHFLASSKPTLNMFKLFHKAGADLNVKNNEGLTLLHVLDPNSFANVHDLLLFLQWLFKKGFDFGRRTRDGGETALHTLLRHLIDRNWATDIMRFFATAGQNFDARNRRGITPENVLNGITRGHSKRISEQALDVEHLRQKDTLMLEVVNNSRLNRMREDPDGRNALGCLAYIHAIPPGQLPHQFTDPRFFLLRQCLQWNLDVNHYDKAGSCPLHSFVFKVRMLEQFDDSTTARYVRLLLEAGADVNLRNRNGDTALHLACVYGRVHCTRVLLRAGADVNAVNDKQNNPIAEAMSWRPKEPDQHTASLIGHCINQVLEHRG